MTLKSLLGLDRTPHTEWRPDRPVRFVTSFDSRLYEASGRTCVEGFRRLNPRFELRAYIEAESADGLAELERDVAATGTGAVRLDDCPLLNEFFLLARDVIPPELGGDAPASMFPGDGPETGNVWFRKHMFRWFRKIVALRDASRQFEGVLMWMDCDCRTTKSLPLDVLDRTFAGAGVIHMKARREHSETGLVGFDLGVPGVHDLLAAMERHYMTRAFEDLPRWDDCITLDLLLARPEAPPSRDIARRVLQEGQVLPATPLAPYFSHAKGLHSRGLGLVR
jgi:hypothetical protein